MADANPGVHGHGGIFFTSADPAQSPLA